MLLKGDRGTALIKLGRGEVKGDEDRCLISAGGKYKAWC